jgi:hypothetical protein
VSKLLSLVLTLFFFGSSIAQAITFGNNSSARINRQNNKIIDLHLELLTLTPTDFGLLGITKAEDGPILQGLANRLNICVGNDSAKSPPECEDTTVLTKPLAWVPARVPAQIVDQTSILETMNGSKVTIRVSTVAGSTTQTTDVFLDLQILGGSDFKTDIQVLPRLLTTANEKIIKPLNVVLGSGIKTEPVLDKVASTKGTIILLIKKPENITFQDDSAGTPSGLQVLLVPNLSTSPTSFPAQLYEDVPSASPTDAECSVALNDTGDGCSISCNQNPHTLDLSGTLPEGMVANSADNLSSSLAVSFENLTINEQPYGMIYSFKPEGTGLGCAIGQPTDAVTLLQIETGREPKAGDPSCFIATAAYGSPLERHVRTLRWFRDTYLIPHDFGKILVKTYYHFSPPAAQWIAERPLLRAIVRGTLWLPVMLIELWRDTPYLLALALLLPTVLLIKRRKTA